MRNGFRSIAVVGVGALLLFGFGCSGDDDDSSSGAPTTAASDGDNGGNGSVTTQSTDGGGGSGAGVCELVTTDELAGIFGVSSVTATVLAGPPDNCIVQSDDGAPLAAWSLTTAQAQSVYDSLTADPSAVDVPGVGDEAAIVENTGLLVLKGDRLVVITISGGADLSEDDATAASKEIAAIAAGRM